jgi:hypothetical protein
VAWLTTIIVTEESTWQMRDVVLTVSVVVFAFAVPLYIYRRRAFPQLAAFASLIVLTSVVLARPEFSGGVMWGAVFVWAVGVAWVLLALGRWHKPVELAIATGSVTSLTGMAIAAAGDGRAFCLGLGLATAIGLIWRGVAIDQTLMVGCGAIGVLAFVPQIVLEAFPEGSSAMVAMLTAGLLLVLLSVGIARGRRHHGDTVAKEDRP